MLAVLLAGCATASRSVSSGEAVSATRSAAGAARTASPGAAVSAPTAGGGPSARGGTAPSATATSGTPWASRAPGATPSRNVPSDLPSSAPMTVRLAAGCVTPGGRQGVVVETLPEAFVAYDNLYADQRGGAVHGGVDGRARSDRHGRFEASWAVSAGAPHGDVRLDIGASAGNKATVRMLFYRVAASCP